MKKQPAHHCHAHGCNRAVPPRMFMCRAHWYALRPVIRHAIWREYVPGQENTKTPTLRYLAVQQRAIAELVFKAHDEEAARTAAEYIAKSEHYRQRSIDAGLGDPLEGIAKAS